jgi:hypothetical protein
MRVAQNLSPLLKRSDLTQRFIKVSVPFAKNRASLTWSGPPHIPADRYVCVTECCITDPKYFQTWSLLQAHIRTVHPPTCPNPGCEDKTFASQKNFKAHLKVHEERDIQESLEDAMDYDKSHDETEGPSKRTIEVGRDWKCEWDSCEKAFKSVCLCVARKADELTGDFAEKGDECSH